MRQHKWMVSYLISLHQVPLHLGTDLPFWQISWKWIDLPQEVALPFCLGHRQSCMSNSKCHQWPQCLRQGGEMRGRDGVKKRKPALGSAALGMHPYVWQTWVRIWLGVLWLTGSPRQQLHQRVQRLCSCSLWPEEWTHRPSLSCPQRQHYSLLKIVPYFAQAAEK